MLPAFDDFGNLPPGMHLCTIEELASRFGSGSEERAAQMSELLHFIGAAKMAGVQRLMVNGSFVTGKLAPNDVDVVFLPGPAYPRHGPRLDSDDMVWPFLQIIVAAETCRPSHWGKPSPGRRNSR
jgi:hypothetical protein